MYPLKIKEKYNQSNLNSLGHRFSVAYLGNYKPGNMDEEAGSHPGVDIVPEKKAQEVFSVLDGTVFKCGEDGAYGKYVFIEHKNVPHPDDFSKTTTLYSCYEHLSEFSVKLGDFLKEGALIGKTGNTGNSFGEHLHFQIDRQEAPYHAYWPYTGEEVRTAGVTFSDGVNLGLGKDKAKMYTINPLVYLDKVASNVSKVPAEKVVVNEVKVSPTPEKVATPVTNIVTPTTNVVTPVKTKPVEVIKPITSDPVVVTPTTLSPTLDSVVSSNGGNDVVQGMNLDNILSDKKKL